MTPRITGARTIASRQRVLLRWYRANGRHALPWRHRITPYRVLVSEIMLQQTQVDRVIPYFTTWMKRWPTVEHLARAKRSDVIRAWAGLGYNRRAVYLHRAAQEIVGEGWFLDPPPPVGRGSKRGWVLRKQQPTPPILPSQREGRDRIAIAPRPHDIAELARALRRLPGIGSYTAHAILAFAWNLPAPCVDVNVRRVLAYAISKRPAIMHMPLAEVERLAARLIPPEQGRAWNSALMDYGALMFQARHVPRQHRPRPAQQKFANSPRFWRGRIVAVLRDADEPCTRVKIFRTLTQHGTPPPLAPLLRTLVRDGVLARHGRNFALGEYNR